MHKIRGWWTLPNNTIAQTVCLYFDCKDQNIVFSPNDKAAWSSPWIAKHPQIQNEFIPNTTNKNFPPHTHINSSKYEEEDEDDGKKLRMAEKQKVAL
jgi:hypothetical protein